MITKNDDEDHLRGIGKVRESGWQSEIGGGQIFSDDIEDNNTDENLSTEPDGGDFAEICKASGLPSCTWAIVLMGMLDTETEVIPAKKSRKQLLVLAVLWQVSTRGDEAVTNVAPSTPSDDGIQQPGRYPQYSYGYDGEEPLSGDQGSYSPADAVNGPLPEEPPIASTPPAKGPKWNPGFVRTPFHPSLLAFHG
ncbi:hypothetical protein AAG570_009205 [Ranatra chinensis]|uniref:Uncharacterized protein n=1 Tax=Ranatra chinensis TaxID=642074 RepID=A0ABD0YT20_9HEMI